MTTEHKDFEVISNSDPDMESSNEDETPDDSKTINSDNNYSQDDRKFMFELYRENRSLLDQMTEKDKQIAKLEERTVFLANSNVFWLCCYVGTAMTTLFSLAHH